MKKLMASDSLLRDESEVGKSIAETVGSPQNDEELIEALRKREESAFAYLLDRYSNSLLRMATFYVPSRAVAEEVE